jgi:hypothetical protein
MQVENNDETIVGEINDLYRLFPELVTLIPRESIAHKTNVEKLADLRRCQGEAHINKLKNDGKLEKCEAVDRYLQTLNRKEIEQAFTALVAHLSNTN